RLMKKASASTVRQSSRLEATESLRILDDAARQRRQRKALESLEQDNYHEDPHANLQWNKKRPKFEDHDIAAGSLHEHKGGRKRKEGEEKLDAASIKKRRMMRSEHFKQRFRKNFMQLLEEENTSNKDRPLEHGAYANASAPPSMKPPRKSCAVCGFTSKYNCVRCGTRFCCIRCRDIHNETRCMRWTA
ncbi:hypothetical protein PFISCL1PPCAC_24843, partial [Pristionchus fissidentatus]